jgi:UDP-glucose-4-epimerase GalE
MSKGENKNILVTGGAGYIGSHVCKALKENDYTPIAYDNLSNGYKQLVKWGPFVKGDIFDSETLSKTIEEYKPIAAMHFAAFIAAGESVSNPEKYYYNNTFGSLNLIKTLNKHGVKKLIFSSTAAVYGDSDAESIDEAHPKNPINPYGTSKLFVEQILKDFQTAHDFQHVALRYFNAAGADIDTETGSLQQNATNLVPVIMHVLNGNSPSLSIFGSDYETPDGTAIRDYIHVSDLASAHLKALEYLFKTNESATFNLGTGKGYSVKEVVDSVEAIVGKPLAFEFVPRREGDPRKLIANASLAYQALGWKAEFSDIETIIKTAWDWEKAKNNNDD